MYKIITKKILLTLITISFPLSSLSQNIGYDFIQGNYKSISDSSLPGIDVDADGFDISGSFSIAPNFAITALYGSIDYDRILGLDVDFTELRFGLTAHTDFTSETDIFGNISVLKVDSEISNGVTAINDDETGNTITVGIRHIINNSVELNADLTREDIFDDTTNILGLGARFYIDQKISLGAGYTSSRDDVDTILLNVRFNIK